MKRRKSGQKMKDIFKIYAIENAKFDRKQFKIKSTTNMLI